MKASNSLSQLEQVIMVALWQIKKGTVRDILGIVGTQKKLAYTSVATMLERLYKKGAVDREENAGTWHYIPKISRQSYSQKTAQAFISQFMDLFGDVALVSFADSIHKLPADKKAQLLKLIESHDQK